MSENLSKEIVFRRADGVLVRSLAFPCYRNAKFDAKGAPVPTWRIGATPLDDMRSTFQFLHEGRRLSEDEWRSMIDATLEERK